MDHNFIFFDRKRMHAPPLPYPRRTMKFFLSLKHLFTVRRATHLASVLLLGTVVSCVEATAPVVTTVEGTYALHTINGGALPYIIESRVDQGIVYSDEIVSFSLALSNGRLTAIQRTYYYVGSRLESVATDTATGSYTVSGQIVNYTGDRDPEFPEESPATVQFTYGINTLTAYDPEFDNLFVWRRN